MKKTLLTLLLAATTLFGARAGGPANLESLTRQYRDAEGFETLSIGPMGLRLLRAATVRFGDLRRLVIIDFDAAPEREKAAFKTRLEKILSGMELILEAKDDEDAVRIYGRDDGGSLRDCVLYDSDGTLIWTKGRIDLRRLEALIAAES